MWARFRLSVSVLILLIMPARSVATGCVSVPICVLCLLLLAVSWLLWLAISLGVLLACPLRPSLVSLYGACYRPLLISVNYLFSLCLPHYVSIMAIICNLFGDAVWTALAADPAGVSAGSSVASAGDPADASGMILNPCVSCPLRGLCDSDYCGMQCFPLDMPECPNNAG